MNKVAIAAATVLALVLLALPRVVGSMTEARVRARVADIDDSSSAAARVTSFERGWFRSHAKIELTLMPDSLAQLGAFADGNPLLGRATLPIAVDFAHGPIAVLDGLHIGWSKMVARLDTDAPGITELEQTLGVPYVFEFRGRTGFDGAIAFDADAPPFQLPIAEALLTFSGAALAGSFDRNRLNAAAEITSLEVTSPTGTFSVGKISGSADNELHSPYVMPGEASFAIERISISDPFAGATPAFEAANLKMTSAVELGATGDTVDMLVTYDLDSLRMQDNELEAASVGFALRSLDVAVLEAYADSANDLADGVEPGVVLELLGPQLERALAAEPRLAFDPIRFRFNGEPFEGKVSIAANAARLPPPGTLNLGNPLLMLGLVDCSAEVRLSKLLARQLATLTAQLQLGQDGTIPPDQLEYMAEAQSGLMLTALVGQGLLLEEGNDYRATFEFAGGALTLNGNPLPFGLP